MRADHGKAERLFRAAVTAFCSLTRPSRREIAQLEDLTLPLYDSVSTEARRFVAAALSECRNSPAVLVRRLADEPVEIAAPLLLRSNALADIDLIALIGRRGIGHARVIARRPHLNPTIDQLVKMLLKSARPADPISTSNSQAPMKPQTAANALPDRQPPLESRMLGAAAEAVRDRLRMMMRPAAGEVAAPTTLEFGHGPRPALYAKLRDTALTGVRAFFQTALADALGIDFRQAQSITGKWHFDDLHRRLEIPGLAGGAGLPHYCRALPGQVRSWRGHQTVPRALSFVPSPGSGGQGSQLEGGSAGSGAASARPISHGTRAGQ